MSSHVNSPCKGNNLENDVKQQSIIKTNVIVHCALTEIAKTEVPCRGYNFLLGITISTEPVPKWTSYCDMGYPLIMVISEDHDTYTYCRTFNTGLSLLSFTTKVSCSWDSNTQPSACEANVLTDCAIVGAISYATSTIFI